MDILALISGFLMWGLVTTPIWLSVLGAYFVGRRLGPIPGAAVLAVSAGVAKMEWWVVYGRWHQGLEPERAAFNQSRLPVLMAIWAGCAVVAVIVWIVRWGFDKSRPAS